MFIFSIPILIRCLWQLKTLVFMHWYIISTVLLAVRSACLKILRIFLSNISIINKLYYTFTKERLLRGDAQYGWLLHKDRLFSREENYSYRKESSCSELVSNTWRSTVLLIISPLLIELFNEEITQLLFSTHKGILNCDL